MSLAAGSTAKACRIPVPVNKMVHFKTEPSTFDPIRSNRYRSGDHEYDSRYGSKDEYKRVYRDAFQRGYEQGYRENRR